MKLEQFISLLTVTVLDEIQMAQHTEHPLTPLTAVAFGQLDL
jgi:hypothetical protein